MSTESEFKRVADLGLTVGLPVYVEYHEPAVVDGETVMVPCIGAFWRKEYNDDTWGLFDGSGNVLRAYADVLLEPNWKIVEVGVKQ